MPRLLIAGCGYLGGATGSAFHAAGWEIEGWTYSGGNIALPFQTRAVDLTNPSAVQHARGSFDAVLHCASSRGGNADAYRRIYFAGARNLAATFPESVLVFASSTSVYAQTDGEWVDEASAAEPTNETAKILRQTEDFVLARGGIIVRLAGIYGPGRSALLRKFLGGTATIDPAARFLNHIHRDDAAAALLLLTQRRVNEEQTESTGVSPIYNVSDNHPLLQREAYAWLAAHFDQPLPALRVAQETRKRGNSNKRVSSRKLRATGWTPKYPTFETAMRESILPGWPHGVV